jgi:WXG100 family type VII secretion target
MSDILVKPHQLRKSATQLLQSARTIQMAVDLIDREIQALGPSRFEGVSAEEIRSRYQRMREKVYSFKPMVDSYAKKLEEAAVRFEQADRTLNT